MAPPLVFAAVEAERNTLWKDAEVFGMKLCVLMGSPRREGNTAALLAPFLDECGQMGVETHTIWLYGQGIGPCLGCMACQNCLDGLGCVQEDGFEAVFQEMAASDVILLATPIYAFFCSAPMKALLDRVIYASVKNYGRERGPKLLEGRRVASLVTCGYPPEKGAGPWEEALKLLCRYGGMEYMGMFCRRDRGGEVPFLDEDRERGVRDFAQAIRMAIVAEELA